MIHDLTTGEYLELVTEDAKWYFKKYDPCASIKRNTHMNEITKDTVVDQKVVEAAIVDFINYMATIRGGDYGLYTRDLRSE
jgi:hypothetical protein